MLVTVILSIGLFAAVAWRLAMMGTATPAAADTLYAPTVTHTTIQAAINAAGDGDRVRIVSGTYYENLDISDDITLEGGWSKGCGSRTYTDPQYTTIDGGAVDHVVEITGGSTATLESLTLTNGQSQKGGGVYVSSASPTLNNVVVTGNAITSTTGRTYAAGVYVYNGTITMTGCEITNNTGDSSDGCGGAGLALYGWGTGAVISATQIMSNSDGGSASEVLRGGGMWLDAGTKVTFEGTENLVAYNEGTYGGGVYMWGNTDLQGLVIRDNDASYSGGGIVVSCCYDGGRIANNYILGNSASVLAASVYAPDRGVEIANNTIVRDASGPGAGIDVYNTSGEGSKVTNNIVVSHAVGIKQGTDASVTVVNNDVWKNTTNYDGLPAGVGDIGVDPEFVDPGNGDYHLAVGSPCINVGANVAGLCFDYDGDRCTGTLFDIGADELHTEPFFVPLIVKKYRP